MSGFVIFSAAGTCVKVAAGVSTGTAPLPLSCDKGYFLASD